jgi:hypothetical protein
MGAGPPVIEKITVEVQYSEAGGASRFYDRAGLVHRTLLDTLGSPPFAPGSEPSPFRSPALVSPTELLTVEYDQKHLVVIQDSVEAIARIEHVASIAWSKVNEQFELRGKVKRAGIRILLMWPARSAEDAETRLLNAGLFRELPRTQEVFGETPRKRSYTLVVGSDERPTRYHLAGASAVVEMGTGAVPAALKKFHIPAGILLDVDCGRVFNHDPRRTINPADLRTFVQESWRQSIGTAKALAALL